VIVKVQLKHEIGAAGFSNPAEIGRLTISDDNVESELCRRRPNLWNRGTGLTPIQVWRAAYIFGEGNEISVPWNKAEKFTGSVISCREIIISEESWRPL